jgi:hypothetical protein
MVKASDLVKEQEKRENLKEKTYDKIYERLEKKIILASEANLWSIWYEIPQFILGIPLYKLKSCAKYLKKKLEKNGFKTDFYKPNLLLIKWSN